MKYVKSVARLLDRDCVNKRGLDLSIEVLWVSVGQSLADILTYFISVQGDLISIVLI